MSSINQDRDDDYEWDDSKATKTAWSLSRQQRGKRAYGRRSSSKVGNNVKIPTYSYSSGNVQTTKGYGRKINKLPKQEVLAKSNDHNHNDKSSYASESSLTSATTKSHSQRTMSLNSFYDLSSNSINEENKHPNLSNHSLHASHKSESSLFDSLSFSTTSGACFSSICRGSMNSSNYSQSGFVDESGDAGFVVPCLTPSRSISSSSRKRGVCDSPLLNCDDMSSSDGLSGSLHPSTSSFGSRRARSRIFSPESTKKIMEAAAAAAAAAGQLEKGEKEMTNIRKKNEESFHESESEMEMDENENSFSFQNTSCEMSQADFEERERNELFVDTIKPSNVEKKQKQILPLPLRPRRMSSVGDLPFEDAIFAPVEEAEKMKGETIFDTMSSYEDLKFLLKELRRWSGGKLLASFGMSKNCTVVPPNSWSSVRRSEFIQWTTTHLGFCHRYSGGNVNYLQISACKAKEVQQDLEKALLNYKESLKKNKKNKNKTIGTAKKSRPDTLQHRTPLPMSSIKISRIDSVPRYTPMSIEKVSVSQKHDCDDILDDLASDLESLNIKQTLSTIDYDNESIMDCGTTPLARMVTLPPDDASFSGNYRPARLSYDNSIMGSRDFVSHMHGISPQVRSNNNMRPSALVLPRRPFSGGKNAVQDFSPAIPVMTAALSFDQAETPGVHKLNNRRWGSRPVPGKDWGQSEKCDDQVICFLSSELEEACSSMGNLVSDPFTNASSCFIRPGMSGVKADSKSLGIEFEVDHQPTLDEFVSENDVEDLESNPLSKEEKEEEDGDELIDKVPSPQEALQLHSYHNTAASNLPDMSFQDIITPEKLQKRRARSFAKHNRMSICNSAMVSRTKPFRPSVFQSKKTAFAYEIDAYPSRQSIGGPSPLKRQNRKSLKTIDEDRSQLVLADTSKLLPILSFLNEHELQCTASLVCSTWADAATEALASLMLISVGCAITQDNEKYNDIDDGDEDEVSLEDESLIPCSVALSMQRPWDYIADKFPWGAFLSEGTFKRVFRVWNSVVEAEEAVSVMDVNQIDDRNIVGNELAVSVMLSSLARRYVCPNFVRMRGVFTASFEPPRSHWGCAENKQPQGKSYDAGSSHIRRKPPRKPPSDQSGLFQYIRMELCKHGDVEEFIRKEAGTTIPPEEARHLLFQMAYSLHVAGDRFGLKHYDVKLLNFFLQSGNESHVTEDQHPFTVLRYGLGSHVFNLRMPTSRALIAKLADFGTANIRADSDGQPVMLNNFTTLENTPPDFLILGDAALQGYGHDCFGLGLCMLHLFTGDSPYEEILESVKCPPNLRKKLKRIWEGNGNRRSGAYTVVRSVIMLDVWEDEDGNVEGEVDETLYDTLYRFLVLFGVPDQKFQWKEGNKVWSAISTCLETMKEKSPSKVRRSKRSNNNKEGKHNNDMGLDLLQFQEDCDLFSLRHGKDERIARARDSLERMDGGMELLFSLVSFDPNKRASALDVMNSTFMEPLREGEQTTVGVNDKVYSYMSYAVVQ